MIFLEKMHMIKIVVVCLKNVMALDDLVLGLIFMLNLSRNHMFNTASRVRFTFYRLVGH